ncbi:MAG TPA: hypothetical protein VFV89_05035 [Nocardioides sp.]|uniref:hypothetical protein n=1 Tax=Nocardioides sp. TaxID=35761 RepID=UPI002E321ABA|nr:hypothetical protein [Nocardioides sp.]HEX5087152.1 hypothetical protein [Nocardioides sp.]
MAHGSGQVTPAGLNAAISLLFVAGSACFVVGSFPGYLDAVGGTADGVTFFVGSVFFTTASASQLLQAQTPALASASADTQHRSARPRWWAWLPGDKAWVAAVTQFPGTLFFNVSTFAALAHNATVEFEDQHVWRPDVFGSTLFLVSSWYGVLAVRGIAARSGDRLPAGIAWLNMLGSVLFMWSAIAAYVLPDGQDLNSGAAVAGTLLGAACFLVGAALMFPAWHRAVHHTALQGETT